MVKMDLFIDLSSEIQRTLLKILAAFVYLFHSDIVLYSKLKKAFNDNGFIKESRYYGYMFVSLTIKQSQYAF